MLYLLFIKILLVCVYTPARLSAFISLFSFYRFFNFTNKYCKCQMLYISILPNPNKHIDFHLSSEYVPIDTISNYKLLIITLKNFIIQKEIAIQTGKVKIHAFTISKSFFIFFFSSVADIIETVFT